MAKGKKTGGRRKGSLNKRTLARLHAATIAADGEAARQALREGATPLEYLLGVMRDPGVDPERRDRCAQAAAPFIHPKLAVTDIRQVSGDRRSLAVGDVTLVFVSPSGERTYHELTDTGSRQIEAPRLVGGTDVSKP